MSMLMEKNRDLTVDDIDSLPLAFKKFMKCEYLIFYEEAKQNESEVEILKPSVRKIEFFTPLRMFI